MEKNPAYGSAQNYTVSQAPTAESIYELMDLPATNEACTDKRNTAAGDHEIPKVDKTSQGRSIVGVIVAVLVLVVAIAAITATVVLSQTNNSNQEIQSLQLEIGNLRAMLNQTGENSNQEIQSLQLEIENLREILNQTADSLVILRTDNQARDRKNTLKNFLCMFTHA